MTYWNTACCEVREYRAARAARRAATGGAGGGGEDDPRPHALEGWWSPAPLSQGTLHYALDSPAWLDVHYVFIIFFIFFFVFCFIFFFRTTFYTSVLRHVPATDRLRSNARHPPIGSVNAYMMSSLQSTSFWILRHPGYWVPPSTFKLKLLNVYIRLSPDCVMNSRSVLSS